MNNRQLEREANEIGFIVDRLIAEIESLEEENKKLEAKIESLEDINTNLEEQVLELKSILP